jgi:hypothetical protein
MTVLAIDLASKRYTDFGLAQIDPGSTTPFFPTPGELGLSGQPQIEPCAEALDSYARSQGISVMLLDGPQGWRHPLSPIEHMRLAERVLNTPGKTGIPGHSKPKTFLAYTTFSIELFDKLRREFGWDLLREGWERRRRGRWLAECFPSSAWQLLGMERLPSKARKDLNLLRKFTRRLAKVTGYTLPRGLTHDQLQAAVVLPAAVAIANRDPARLIMVGFDPLPAPGGSVYEGWIVNPRVPSP